MPLGTRLWSGPDWSRSPSICRLGFGFGQVRIEVGRLLGVCIAWLSEWFSIFQQMSSHCTIWETNNEKLNVIWDQLTKTMSANNFRMYFKFCFNQLLNEDSITDILLWYQLTNDDVLLRVCLVINFCSIAFNTAPINVLLSLFCFWLNLILGCGTCLNTRFDDDPAAVGVPVEAEYVWSSNFRWSCWGS